MLRVNTRGQISFRPSGLIPADWFLGSFLVSSFFFFCFVFFDFDFDFYFDFYSHSDSDCDTCSFSHVPIPAPSSSTFPPPSPSPTPILTPNPTPPPTPPPPLLPQLRPASSLGLRYRPPPADDDLASIKPGRSGTGGGEDAPPPTPAEVITIA